MAEPEPAPLHVCVVTELSGGVGVYARNLLTGLVDRGVRVTLVTPHPDSAPTVDRVVPVKAHRGRGRFVAQAWSFAGALRGEKADYDLVHVIDARYSLFMRRLGEPVVGTMNDYFYAITGWFSPVGTKAVYEDWRLRHVYYNLTRLLERTAFRRLDGVLCIAQEVKDTLVRRYRLDPRRLVVVPYGIEYGPTDVEPRRSGRPTVVFAGGNFQRKGLGVLIDAAPAILREVPDLEIVVIGSSRDEALMKKRVRERGLTSTFTFVGQVSYRDLYSYYMGADVFAMPSLLEAFGIPFLEGMHCGVPVVASDSPGPTDYLRDGENCLMPARGDVGGLAQAILSALTDPELRERLIRNGRVTAAQATVDTMVSRTVEAYRTILALPERRTR
jgi:glycosyltransferase involved in cell wall biosynthesis